MDDLLVTIPHYARATHRLTDTDTPLPLSPLPKSACSSGAGVAAPSTADSIRSNPPSGGSTRRVRGSSSQSFAHREEASLVLRDGPDQLPIEATPRACGAAALELGDGAEPGACGQADGSGLGKVLVARAAPRVGFSPHRAAGVLPPATRKVSVGAAAHLAVGSGARSASTQGLAARECAMT